MKSSASRIALLVAVLAIVSLPLVAMAAEDEGDEGATTQTSVAPVDSGLSPAVVIEDPEEAAALQDWTYRYMVPAGLVIAAVIVLMVSIKYFTDVVRRRYRIAEE